MATGAHSPGHPDDAIWDQATKELHAKYSKTNEYLVENGARIVIVGSTGVGKSSVLNACFKQKELAAVGGAVPMTGYGGSENVMYYAANSDCSVHLYDTKGFEAMSDNKDILKALKNLVAQRKQAAERAGAKFGPESPQFHAERIHCLWWVTAERLEVGLAKAMADIFREIPIIIIANKSDKPADTVQAVIDAATGIMADQAKAVAAVIPVVCDPKNGPLMKICPTCKSSRIAVTAADEDEKGSFMCKNKECEKYKVDIELRDSYGIDNLLKTTVKLLPEMVAISFQHAQKEFLEDLDTTAMHRIYFYVTAAGGIGATPIPFSDFPLLMANEVTMVTNLANVYALPLNIASIRQWIWALMSTAGVAGVGMAFGSLIKMIPGWGSVAGGISNAVIASSFTFGLGMLAMELFRRVRGLAVHGEITAEHFKQVMSVDEQKAFLLKKISEWKAIKDAESPDKVVED